METPTMTHFKALKRILRYIKGTINFDLFYGYSNSFDLVCYNDSDWAKDMDDRKNTHVLFSTWETQLSHGIQKSNLLSYYLLVKLNM